MIEIFKNLCVSDESMDQDTLLNKARWEIVKAISAGRASATELAETTKSSLPNVSQQMKLLEAYDLVEYVRDQKTGGKPRQIYQLKKEFCHVTFARHGFAEKRFFNPDPYHTMLLNVLFVPSMQDHAYLHKFLALHEDLLAKAAIAFVKSNETEIDLLLLTEHIDEIRAKYSNTIIEHNGKMRKIIAWTHNLHELQEGTKRKEAYFTSMLSDMRIIHDPKNQFEKV